MCEFPQKLLHFKIILIRTWLEITEIKWVNEYTVLHYDCGYTLIGHITLEYNTVAFEYNIALLFHESFLAVTWFIESF